jgi:hypothetical protein
MNGLVVGDFDALRAVDAVERVARWSAGEMLDLGAHALTMVDGEVGAVDIDRDVDALFDDEALVFMKMDDFMILDPVTFFTVDAEQDAALFVDEGFDFGTGAGLVVNVVRVTVDFDLDGRVHDVLSLCARPSRSVLLSLRGKRPRSKRNTPSATFSEERYSLGSGIMKNATSSSISSR